MTTGFTIQANNVTVLIFGEECRSWIFLPFRPKYLH